MHIDWRDLETVEALVRTGSVVGAARALALRHTSVSRRVDALERALGAALFLRGARMTPTPLARSIAERAGPMRAQALEIEALVDGHTRAEQGRLIITTNDVLAPLLFEALRQSPLPAQVEVLTGDVEQHLEPGGVDLALRPGAHPEGSLRGTRLGRLRLGVFHAKGLPGHHRTTWVLPSSGLRARASMTWLKVVPLDAEGSVECSSLLAMRDACVAGLGRAALPAFLGEADPRLVFEAPLEAGPPVWLLAPATRALSPSVRRARASLGAALRALPSAWASSPGA